MGDDVPILPRRPQPGPGTLPAEPRFKLGSLGVHVVTILRVFLGAQGPGPPVPSPYDISQLC